MRARTRISLAALAVTICAFTGSASAAVNCNLVASPNGSDSAAGTVDAPFQTPQKLADSLQAGQTGCLRAGTYPQDVQMSRGGSQGAPTTLTSYPGETATIVGRFYVAQGANDVTVTGLHLDGSNASLLPSPSIDANQVTFSYDDVTNNHTAICFDVGSQQYGTAANTLITHDRIHGCGVLPPQNHDHGIYVQAASYTRIEWNLIYDNADRGVQLYPDAQYTTIDHNVIDNNGEALDISGDGGRASNHAEVYGNLLTNSTVRFDAESWYPSGNPLGTANVVHDNCVWGGRLGTINTSNGGFTAVNNTIANPQYADAANHNYHLQPTSPCLVITGDIAAVVDGTTPTRPAQGHRGSGQRNHRHHGNARARFASGNHRKHHAHRRGRHHRHHLAAQPH